MIVNKKYCLAGILCCLCSQSQLQAANQSAPGPALAQRLAAFDSWVASRMAMERMPGLTIGFAQGEVEWVKGYGYADLENRVPASARSSYRMASVTKPMTAVAILQLVEQGKVDLDAPVQTYVPYFPLKPFPVTVRQLLGHLGGIDAYRNSRVEQHFKEHKNTRQSLAVFEHFGLIAEPGTRYRYTSYGYNLLGAVIEGASGTSYGQYMQRHVWQPLGMTATMLDDPALLIAHRVRGYGLEGNTLTNSEFVDISSRFAAGGTRASVPDMLAFGKGVHAGKVLSAASVAAMSGSMATRDGKLTDYGMGWDTYPTGGRHSISHSGQQPETATYLYSFPSRQLTIAVASNLQRANTEAFAQRLFEVVMDEPWQLKTYVAHADDQYLYQVAQGLFEEGRAWLERSGGPCPADMARAQAAFAQINSQALAPAAPSPAAFIAAARHPAGGRVFLAAGASIACSLRQSGIDLDRYGRSGALAFMRDYVLLSQGASGAPRLAADAERTMIALADSWDRTGALAWPAQPLPLAALAASLASAFRAQRAYPDFVAELRDLAQASAARGDLPNALAASQLAVTLYPHSSAAQVLQGLMLLRSGQPAAAVASLRVALLRDLPGAASAAALNLEAYRLKGSGAVAHATAVLQAAIELHPHDVNLQDSLAEFYAEQGMYEQAVAAYQQALRLDPAYPAAAAARAAIARMQSLP